MDCSNGDWTAISASWKNSPHSSPGWEEYGNYTQPGVHPYHESSLPAEDSSDRPRGILTVDADLQYSFHSEPSSTAPPYQRRRPVGHPSPTPYHHVLTRITSCPRASGTPSGASISQSSFCVPPHIPAWPPTPFRYSPYDLRLAMSLASPERLDIQPVSVPGVIPRNYVQSSYTFPALCQDRLSDVPPTVRPPRPPVPTWLCPRCREPFLRPQDRKRHLMSHLPYWVGCSYDGCSWRGYRLDAFRKHWCSEHQSTGQVPDESGSRLYDPGPLVDGIIRGSISIRDAENWAITRIRAIASSLDKDELFMNPWGRKGKNLKTPRRNSRVMKALPITTPSSLALQPRSGHISPHHAPFPGHFADIPATPAPVVFGAFPGTPKRIPGTSWDVSVT